MVMPMEQPDVLGWQIVKATERDRQALQKAGYHLPVKED